MYGGMRLVVGIENTYEERGSASLLKMVYVNLCFRCFLWKIFLSMLHLYDNVQMLEQKSNW